MVLAKHMPCVEVRVKHLEKEECDTEDGVWWTREVREEGSQIVVMNGKEVKAVGETGGKETRQNPGSTLRPSHLIMASEVWFENKQVTV